jgi:hypothetical protein
MQSNARVMTPSHSMHLLRRASPQRLRPAAIHRCRRGPRSRPSRLPVKQISECGQRGHDDRDGRFDVAPHAQYDGPVGERRRVRIRRCFCDLCEAREGESNDDCSEREDNCEAEFLLGRDLEFPEELEGEDHDDCVGDYVGACGELYGCVGSDYVFWGAASGWGC